MEVNFFTTCYTIYLDGTFDLSERNYMMGITSLNSNIITFDITDKKFKMERAYEITQINEEVGLLEIQTVILQAIKMGKPM